MNLTKWRSLLVITLETEKKAWKKLSEQAHDPVTS